MAHFILPPELAGVLEKGLYLHRLSHGENTDVSVLFSVSGLIRNPVASLNAGTSQSDQTKIYRWSLWRILSYGTSVSKL